MPDEQDRAEALDDDKGAFTASGETIIDILDQTADAEPGSLDAGRSIIDDDEAGNDLIGVEAEPDRAADPFHNEEPPPEVAALHIEEEA